MIKINKVPMMGKDEYQYIENIISDNDIMLEYGAGSSTLYFSEFVKEYVSIEHDKNWFDILKECVGDNVKIYHGECYYINNNTHCDYTKENQKELWRPYFEMIHNIPKNKYDKILIDGRARAYCAIEVFEYLKDDGVLLIHDYIGRKKYHDIVENKYEKIKTINSLGIFKKKKYE